MEGLLVAADSGLLGKGLVLWARVDDQGPLIAWLRLSRWFGIGKKEGGRVRVVVVWEPLDVLMGVRV